MVRVLPVAVALVLTLVACGSTAAPSRPAASPQGRTIDIELREFSFTPAALTLRSGETVTLRLRNAGTTEHELMAGRGANPAGGGFREDFFKGVEVKMSGGTAPAMGDMGHAGVGLRVPTAKIGTMTFKVPSAPGLYEIGCFVPGHYEGGMKGTLTIQ